MISSLLQFVARGVCELIACRPYRLVAMASAERELCTVSVIAHVSLFLLSLGAHLTFATSEATTSSVSDLNDVQLRIGTGKLLAICIFLVVLAIRIPTQSFSEPD